MEKIHKEIVEIEQEFNMEKISHVQVILSYY